MLDLSIVIVSWNTREITRECLESVYRQTRGIHFEVIVVDNASEDGSAQMVAAQFPQVVLICSPSNVGFAAANNLGFKVAKGRYILLLNSDTVVLDGALQRTLEYADSRDDLGIVSCKVLNKDRTLQPNCSMLPSNLNFLLMISGLYKAFPKNRFFGRAEMTWWDYSCEREVEVLKGCFMLVRRDALQEVGDMDAQFFMYCEEVDWCKRFADKGWKLGFFPHAQIIHLGGSSAAKLGPERARIKDRSTLYYMRKHWSPLQQLIGKILMLGFYGSRLPAAAVLALLTGNERFGKIRANHWAGITGLLK